MAIRPTTRVTRSVPTGRFQQSRGMFGFSGLPERRLETTTEPIGFSPAEATADVIRDFNQAPITYTTGPNGELIATRSLDRPQRPPGVGPLPPNLARIFAQPDRPVSSRTPGSRGMFGSPNIQPTGAQNIRNDPLTSTFVLPQREGPRISNRLIPTSDAQRSRFANTGFRGTPAATLNPTYIPEEYLRVPLRESSFGGFQEPIFGGVTDFTQGRFTAPNVLGTIGQEFTENIRGISPPGTGASPALAALNNINAR